MHHAHYNGSRATLSLRRRRCALLNPAQAVLVYLLGDCVGRDQAMCLAEQVEAVSEEVGHQIALPWLWGGFEPRGCRRAASESVLAKKGVLTKTKLAPTAEYIREAQCQWRLKPFFARSRSWS